MKKKSLKKLIVITIAFMVPFIFINDFINYRNTRIFLRNLAELEENDVIELKELATFDWDKMFVITPYGWRSAEEFNRAHSLNLRFTPPMSDHFLLVIFVKNDKQIATISSNRRLGERFWFTIPTKSVLYYCDDNYYTVPRRWSQSVTLELVASDCTEDNPICNGIPWVPWTA